MPPPVITNFSTPAPIQPPDIAAAYYECFRKRAYPTESFARKVARAAKNSRGVKLRIYFCPHCQNFHLTKNLERK